MACVLPTKGCGVSQQSVSVSGQKVTIGGIGLSPLQELTITYAEAKVPAAAGYGHIRRL